MADPAPPPTGDTPPSETPPAGDTPPASGVTPPKGDAPATNEETITLKKGDYDNLVSQRDKANNAIKDNEGQEAFVESLAQERAIGKFLKDNAETYPDVTADDLSHVLNPDDLKPEAERLQRRLEDHAQKKIMDIEKTKPPVLTEKEKADKLKNLKKNKPADAFEQMVDMQMAA